VFVAPPPPPADVIVENTELEPLTPLAAVVEPAPPAPTVTVYEVPEESDCEVNSR
jgi:hypothetical protein